MWKLKVILCATAHFTVNFPVKFSHLQAKNKEDIYTSKYYKASLNSAGIKMSYVWKFFAFDQQMQNIHTKGDSG